VRPRRGSGAVVEFGAEVAGASIRRHVACVAARAQNAAGELVETEGFGARQLDRAVRRRAHRGDRQRGGDVLGRFWLNQHGWDPNVSPLVLESAMRPMNSKNWVARTIVYGTVAALIASS
jgi:hypothetical protein